jgi:hypothetical protein
MNKKQKTKNEKKWIFEIPDFKGSICAFIIIIFFPLLL